MRQLAGFSFEALSCVQVSEFKEHLPTHLKKPELPKKLEPKPFGPFHTHDFVFGAWRRGGGKQGLGLSPYLIRAARPLSFGFAASALTTPAKASGLQLSSYVHFELDKATAL